MEIIFDETDQSGEKEPEIIDGILTLDESNSRRLMFDD